MNPKNESNKDERRESTIDTLAVKILLLIEYGNFALTGAEERDRIRNDEGKDPSDH